MKRPKYRKHSTRDFGFVEWKGKRTRLPGKYNSPESKRAYERFLESQEVPFIQHQTNKIDNPSVADIVLEYLRYAKQYYPKGKGEFTNCRSALQHLLEFHANHPASEFGPSSIKVIRETMIQKGISRSYINTVVSKIKRCFRWAASEELLPATVHASLATVDGLRRGRTAARETGNREPVPWQQVAPILQYLTPQLAAMVQFQWYTGCRSQSVCLLQCCQFNGSGEVWEWRPRHKMEHVSSLLLPVGPRAQAAIAPFVAGCRTSNELVFSPRKAGGNPRYREAYSSISYRQALVRAQQKAKIKPWTPHQIRHGRGTQVRRDFGLEAAQAILGHGSIDSSQIYAESRTQLAFDIARRIG